MTVKGKILPLGNKVFVRNMHFGEQLTKTGIYIPSDDGKSEGIKPRWGQVYAKGPKNEDPYQVGDWVLVEHGRWTRGIEIENSDNEKFTVRMIDVEAIIMWDDKKPDDVSIGSLTSVQTPSLEDYKV